MFRPALLALLLIPSVAAAAKLETKIFTASPEGFLVNATLVSGAKDAILIDAMFLLADATKVADVITASKKNLTTIYVTHGHPDHYFGLTVLKQRFPKAKIVALPDVVAEIKETAKAKAAYWGGVYGDKLTKDPVIPDTLTGTTLTLEGEKLEIKGHVQGDDGHNSYVWIPSTKTVIAGDIVFDGVFLWTAETQPADRAKWTKSLDELAALKPATVIPGHQKADRTGAPANLAFAKEYLAAYDAAVTASKTPEDAQKAVKAKYGDLALDVILKIGTEAAYKK